MQYYNLAKLEEWERRVRIQQDKRCVFISHKKEDEDAAIAIGSYLTDVVGINIYLDVKDCILSEAVSAENDQKIVESIKRGLDYSTHLLCLISDKTKLSWWVPYEIGYADRQSIDVSVLKLKDVDDIPSYLKIKRTLYNKEDFLRYISALGPYGSLFAEKGYRYFSARNDGILDNHLDQEGN